ncbi:MAG: divergent polysaccharide deacetylase family protein [Micropepsaceae bacterium]
MKIPGLQLPGIVQPIAHRIRSLFKAQSPGSLATIGVTLAVALLFMGVSLLGSGEESYSSTVIRISGSPGSQSTQSAAPSQAVSLIAANGEVISDPDLIEMSADGPLPKISRDGRLPMSVYARKLDKSDPRPKIVLIVTGMGLSASLTQTAIDTLPPGISLAFTPYGSSLQGMASAARAIGHEVLLEVPLEPYDYPNNDPGQNTLLAEAPVKDNVARLNWVLSRFTGFAGLINSQGSKYLASPKDTQSLMDQARMRGLYLFDNGVSDQSLTRETARATGTAFARATRVVDAMPSQEAIEKELAALEREAQERGLAVAVASAYPVTIERLKVWALGLEQKGLSLAPASAAVVSEKVPALPKPVRATTPTHSKPEAAVHANDHSEPGPHP